MRVARGALDGSTSKVRHRDFAGIGRVPAAAHYQRHGGQREEPRRAQRHRSMVLRRHFEVQPRKQRRRTGRGCSCLTGKVRLRHRGFVGQCDVVSEAFELRDEAFGLSFGVAVCVVVGAESR